MDIDLHLVGKKGLELMEQEIQRIMEQDRSFFVDKFPFDKDASHYLLCLNSYEASGGQISPDFQQAISQNAVFKRYSKLIALGDFLEGVTKDYNPCAINAS